VLALNLGEVDLSILIEANSVLLKFFEELSGGLLELRWGLPDLLNDLAIGKVL